MISAFSDESHEDGHANFEEFKLLWIYFGFAEADHEEAEAGHTEGDETGTSNRMATFHGDIILRLVGQHPKLHPGANFQ